MLHLFICYYFVSFQAMPVAASTISLLMLSLDRYATVKHPRLAQLRERRFLPIVLAIGAWLGAVILCTPYLLAYRIGTLTVEQQRISTHHLPSPLALSKHQQQQSKHTCLPDYGSTHMHIWFICVHTLFVFIFPALGVILNHLGVRKKLCALSLTARAAHGELPLPMPILRRPTHMIIVTGMANAGLGVVDHDSSDDDQDNNIEEKRCMMEAKMRCNPRTPR